MKTKMILLVAVFILGLSTASKVKAEEICGTFHVTCGDGNNHYGIACGNSHGEIVDDVEELAEALC